jgi:hypothetical protein
VSNCMIETCGSKCIFQTFTSHCCGKSHFTHSAIECKGIGH